MTQEEDFTGVSPARPPVAASPLRFSLYTLMSATAVFAVWMAYYLTLQETKRMETQLPGLRDMARELHVVDPQQFAAVRHQELSQEDNRWRVYLPPDDKYQLCVATTNRDIFLPLDQRQVAPSMVAPLEAGERELSLFFDLQREEWLIQVSVDGQIILHETQPLAWHPGRGAMGGNTFTISRQKPTDEPLILYDSVFNIPIPGSPGTSSAADSDTGLRVWVEKLK